MVSYIPHYKTASSDKVTCWEGEQFPLSCRLYLHHHDLPLGRLMTHEYEYGITTHEYNSLPLPLPVLFQRMRRTKYSVVLLTLVVFIVTQIQLNVPIEGELSTDAPGHIESDRKRKGRKGSTATKIGRPSADRSCGWWLACFSRSPDLTRCRS